MKKVVLSAITIVLALSLCACGQSGPYPYDLSEYVTLGQYKGVEYTYNVQEVTDELVEERVHEDLSEKAYSSSENVTDRGAVEGDKLNIDFEGTVDGERLDSATAQGQTCTIGEGRYIEGFEEGLIGAEVGQSVTLNLTFPEDYNAELAGKDVVFVVKVNSITQTNYPELTDEIVQDISDKETIDEYLQSVRDELADEVVAEAEQDKRNQIWTTIVSSSELIQYPDKELNEYKESIRENLEESVQSNYDMTLEEYYAQVEGGDEQALDEYLTASAQNAVKEYMVMYSIARTENITVNDDELDTYAESYASQNGYGTVSKLYEYVSREQLRQSVLANKVVDFVVENAVEK